jgi:hypothetical protein
VVRGLSCVILPTAKNDTLHTNQKRKRGDGLTPSLALRVSARSSRGQFRSLAEEARIAKRTLYAI